MGVGQKIVPVPFTVPLDGYPGTRYNEDMSTELHEKVYAVGSCDEVYVDGDHRYYAEGDSEPVITLMLAVDVESLTVTMDAYHLTELRKAIQKAERWMKAEAKSA